MIDANDVKQIARECREYAAKYNCSLAESLIDWEGGGPESWGLDRDEQDLVARELNLGNAWFCSDCGHSNCTCY